jgi:branched-chain amino acid transport system permease protein
VEYILHVVVTCEIYAILALSLEIVAGQAGLLSVGQGALLGIGAYTAALMALHATPSYTVCATGSMVATAVIALAIGLATRRMRGDIFAVATFGLQVVVSSVFVNWQTVTRGPLGIPGIPEPTLLARSIQRRSSFAILTGAVLIVALSVVVVLARSPWGRVLRAVREDERIAEVFGKRAARAKIEAFAVSGVLAGLAGCAFSFYFTYIEPSSFGVMESLLVLSMVVVGGAGNPWGAILGAVALVSLPELLRFLGLPAAVAANLRQIAYGVLLISIVIVRPRGLVGRYAFGSLPARRQGE